jgi:hypothetical protein
VRGNLSRARRLATNLTSVNRTYPAKLEKGARYLGLEIVAKLTTVLGVEPAELLRVPSAPRSC